MHRVVCAFAVMFGVACGGATVPRSPSLGQTTAKRAKPASGNGADQPAKRIAPKSKTSTPSKPVATEPTAPAPRPPVKAASLTIAAVGDIMLGSTFPAGRRLPPDDGKHMIEAVKKTLSAADITFGNLEGPMLTGGTSAKCKRMRRRKGKRKTCYAFRVPPRYARYLADAGFDMLSLANNHAMDFGKQGRESTKAVLDKYGIGHAGAPGSVAERTVDGIKVGMIAFATAWHSYDLRKIDRAVAVVKAAAQRYDILMVSFHGGAEGRRFQHVPRGTEYYLRENRGDLRKFSHAVIDAGADIVLGSGPHVVRGMEVYRGRLIAYSLGNFATYSFIMSGPYGISCILEAKLANDGRLLSGVIHPTRQHPVRGTTPDPKRRIIGVLRRLSKADFGDHAIVIADDGTFRAPRHAP